MTAPASSTTPSGTPATAAGVLEVIAAHDAVMQQLGMSVVQHVSRRNPDGPDERLDTCPCTLGPDSFDPVVDGTPELGGGQYLSSRRHNLADVVREALAAEGNSPP